MYDKFAEWAEGCYGLKYPATLVTGDFCLYRAIRRVRSPKDIEILTGIRSPTTRWEPNVRVLILGGFVNPEDEDIYATVKRECAEEVKSPNANIIFDDDPFMITGPKKFRYRWDAKHQRAVNTGRLVQDIPLISVNFFAAWQEGDFEDSEEIHALEWMSLLHLLNTNAEYGFDSARVLPHLKERFQL